MINISLKEWMVRVSSWINSTNTTMAGKMTKTDILNTFYPVGTVYMTNNASFKPANAWGGTWTLESEGYAIISGSQSGSYKVGTNYGSNTKDYTPGGSVKTTLSLTLNGTTLTGAQSGRPNHGHNINIMAGSGSTAAGYAAWSGNQGGGNYGTINNSAANASASHTHSFHTATASSTWTGTKASINVMQSSRTYYIWRRTA